MSTAQPFLPYGRHLIDDDDIAAVVDALKSDFLTTGPRVAAFEKALAAATRARHAIACTNGTAALHLVARAMNLGPGTVSIVPAVTFLATANAVRLNGGDVVFADVDPDSGLMRPRDLEEALSRCAGGRADAAIADSLFEHVLDLEMRAKKTSTGALANVMKEFEAVREFCTSSTLTTLVDLPFAIFFLVIIGLVGGGMVWVPIIAIPFLIGASLVVQPMLARLSF